MSNYVEFVFEGKTYVFDKKVVVERVMGVQVLPVITKAEKLPAMNKLKVVNTKKKKTGLPKARQWSAEEIEKAAMLIKKGLSITETAEKIARSPSALMQAFVKNKLTVKAIRAEAESEKVVVQKSVAPGEASLFKICN